jgi:hypothetical protein
MFGLGFEDEAYIHPDCRPNMWVYSTLIRTGREKFGLKFKSPWLGEK